MNNRYKAIQLFSGGLDSILAARIMRDQGFDISAIHFYTGFNDAVAREVGRGLDTAWEPNHCVAEAADYLGITLVPMDVSDDFRDIMLNPRYGYGSSANPCIDCRIFLLSKARELMEAEGAVLVFTGEVVGQRPMSQYRNTLRLVEKRSGLDGRLLRPLSARLLDPTIPELDGIVDRERLFDIEGRSRKRQQELARDFGIDFYPSPGGGCVLTMRQFGEKFNDLVSHAGDRDISSIELKSLITGRHLRLDSGVKIIVGRNKEENDWLLSLLSSRYWYFMARDFQGPIVFALDSPEEEDFPAISAITARYGKGSGNNEVVVQAVRGEETKEFTVKPASPEETDALLITSN